MPAHLFIAATAHGYGHVAQVSAVARALRRRDPDLRITLAATVDDGFVRERMPAGTSVLPLAMDVPLPMDGPLRVKWAEGLAVYEAFDAESERHLADQRALLAELRPDLVLADVPWLPLAAARSLGIPAVGLCSLNWLDILAESPVGHRLPAALVAHMRDAYAGAELFLRPAPSMPMSWLPNGRDIGPIAVVPERAPAALRRRLGIGADTRLVLMQFGGAGSLKPPADLPLPPRTLLLTPVPLLAEHPGTRLISTADVAEVLAGCDAVITKPGYGTFAEAACHGLPVLSVPRGDWPEEPHLDRWLAARVPFRSVPLADFVAGRIAEPLAELLAAGPAEPVPASGVDETVELLAPWLWRGG
jgi:UDP:flavonoid glycosyltransferase YjiC (YdhE family)